MRTFELKRQTERFGDIALEIETLADLDRTIDQMCQGVDEKSAEAVFLEELCPYFGVVWPAARAAAEHLAQMGGWLKGKTLLEVGCGLALPSLVAAKLGARVVATDFHPEVPNFLKRNLELNGLEIEFRRLDWRDESSGLGLFDFVVGSDILYESGHSKPVAQALARACHKESHVLLTDPGRTYLQACVDELDALGFRHDMFIRRVRDLHSDRAGDRPTKEVFVVVFQKT